jgi:tetratricopeptide (TPR) repeat protein
MFKQLFDSMNDALDDLIAAYPTASPPNKADLDEKLRVLRSMSDTFIEEWLLFEEKLGKYTQAKQQLDNMKQTAADPELSGKNTDAFQKGQGYYKLQMFPQAIAEFEPLVKKQPEFMLARVYLAMAFLKLGDTTEAFRHFQFLTEIAENSKMKAISYNAMGCILIQKQNLELACECFDKAYKSDPASIEPLIDMGLCYEDKGKLQFMI